MAAQSLKEYELNRTGIDDVFGTLMHYVDASEKAQGDVFSEILKMLELRLKSNAPKRPPKILIRGPPGSGCETQGKALA